MWRYEPQTQNLTSIILPEEVSRQRGAFQMAHHSKLAPVVFLQDGNIFLDGNFTS